MAAELISVEGDPNDHKLGALEASQSSVFVNGIPVIIKGDDAKPDKLCTPGSVHCAPSAEDGALTVFIEGTGVHLNKMSRACGAETVVEGQINVFVGDQSPVSNITTVYDDPIPKAIALGEPITPPYIFSEPPYETVYKDGKKIS